MIGERASGPLAGVRVVDASTSYAGPTATMYLADLGATVLKIERPVGGDDARHWGPPFLGGESAWFLAANRNKSSVAIDLADPAGRDVLMRLLTDADVFVESFNPAKLAKLGIDPATLRERFPRLVYCAISAFGLEGPHADRPGYDLIAQARSGLMSVTGPEGGSPERVSTALSDIVAGMVAALAVTAAVRRQEREGVGDVVDVSLLDADLALMAPRIASFLAGEAEPAPSGATDSVIAVYQRFATADEPIVVAAGNDSAWHRLCAVLDLPDLAEVEELATNAGRRAQRPHVVDRLARAFATRGSSEWIELLTGAGVPCSAVQHLGAVVADPQVVARKSIRALDHPAAGSHRVVAPPWRLWSNEGEPAWQGAPGLSTSTDDALGAIGLGPEEIGRLRAAGVVGGPG